MKADPCWKRNFKEVICGVNFRNIFSLPNMAVEYSKYKL